MEKDNVVDYVPGQGKKIEYPNIKTLKGKNFNVHGYEKQPGKIGGREYTWAIVTTSEGKVRTSSGTLIEELDAMKPLFEKGKVVRVSVVEQEDKTCRFEAPSL
jgi:hypothetical protein